MKVLSKLTGKTNYARVFELSKLISIVGVSQVLVQLFGFCSGILVIRLLPQNEYALYTLSNTMLGMMTVLADGGIGAATMAQGGKTWKDRQKLGVVMSTGMHLRKKFSIGSLIIALPVLIYFLRQHNASWLMSFLIAVSLIPAFFAGVTDTLLEVALKLKQDITALQLNQINVNIGRLFLITLTLFIFPWTAVAIISSGIPRIWGNFKLRKI
ncbi:MAG: polysaccharide biosynthesis protein, partial [Ignavibacteriaceae bacterium]